MVRYRHGSAILETHKLSEVMSNNKWSWTPPMTDYQGYLVEVYTETNDQSTILGTVAVDVSSDWKRFPRYGFIADFDNAGGSIDKNANIKNEMAYLNRLHINIETASLLIARSTFLTLTLGFSSKLSLSVISINFDIIVHSFRFLSGCCIYRFAV